MRRAIPILLLLPMCSAPVTPSQPERKPPVQEAVRLEGADWILTSLRGRPPLARPQITLKFANDGAGGYSGCNWYGGKLSVTGTQIEVEEISQTMRGCPGPIEEQEKSYHRALSEAKSFEGSRDRLILRGAGGVELLAFGRRHPRNMNPAQLVGTSWQLQANPEVTIVFARDTISGFAGCRDYTGTYRAVGDEIRIPSLAMSETECDRGNQVNVQEGDFTTDLSETTHYRLEGEMLELYAVSGRTLLFSRRHR
jgi:heat shock protein HslJ